MNPGRPRAPFDRPSQIDAARRHVDRLLDSKDAFTQLGDPTLLMSLGAALSSPFRGGDQSSSRLQANLVGALENMPPLESGVSKPALPLKIGVFGEEALLVAFRGSATMIEIDPMDWESCLEESEVLLLGPTSARTHRSRGKVIDAARSRGLPVLFIDLSVHTPRPDQVTLAARCDSIFAISEENAERYRSSGPRRMSVSVIPTPISPINRSPLGSQSMREPLVTYLGDVDARLPVDALESLEWILDGVAAAGSSLLISPAMRADRPVPVRHLPYVQDWAAQHQGKLDRLSDIGIVAHEVSGSQTAFSARAIELQAAGSMVLSTYNQGINSYYPQIHVANSSEDVASMLDCLEINDLRRNQSDGIRQVFNSHHAVDVLHGLLVDAGVPQAGTEIRVLAVSENSDESLSTELATQTSGAVEIVSWREAAARHGQYDVLVPVSAKHHYSPTYIADHLAALSYQSAPVVSKSSHATAMSYNHTDAHSAELALTAWWKPDLGAASDHGSMHELLSNTRIFVSDGFGHRERTASRPRRTALTLAAGDDFAATKTEIARTAEEQNLELSVVVPVYNNGPHLRHKAFASLQRSSAFNHMHVLLVSDGSTDPVTLDIIEDLVEDNPNVSSFHHARGGSGSASRPRNTGLELAQTQYVTYLDPDNEAIDDGYAELYREIQNHSGVDFVLGNMSQWAKRRSMLPYAKILQTLFAENLGSDGNIRVPDRALEALHFRPMGIQTVVAQTAWLKSLNLTQPVGAVGQDSYFFQQMLHYASSIRTVDIGVHTYYMVVSNSTVNTINPNYFKKYLPLDKARAQWLAEVGLLDAYKSQRLEPFLVSWLLPKLRRVLEHEWLEAAENLAELLNYYGDYRWTQPTAIDFWDDLRRARSRRAVPRK